MAKPFRIGLPGVSSVRAPRAVTRTERKLALCGSHTATLRDAPWNDPSWEFWGHASSHLWYPRPMDRYFDLHDRVRWSRSTKKKGHGYPEWLGRLTVPVYMQQHYPEVPASIKYPKGRILMEFSYAHQRHYFTNHLAWMCALAITEGVTHIGLFGISYKTQSEYERQRGCAEYWLGQCDARGIHVLMPEACNLLRDPARLYGYDSHDEDGNLRDEYKRRKPQKIDELIPGMPRKDIELTDEIKALIAEEEALYPRPEWARSDGGVNA